MSGEKDVFCPVNKQGKSNPPSPSPPKADKAMADKKGKGQNCGRPKGPGFLSMTEEGKNHSLKRAKNVVVTFDPSNMQGKSYFLEKCGKYG
ncbi:MAG TPA: hypothetical protein VMW84_03605 [Acidobacteriota bacterium]|nr:hypothetical protein [Acidobacteriota bacterium]